MKGGEVFQTILSQIPIRRCEMKSKWTLLGSIVVVVVLLALAVGLAQAQRLEPLIPNAEEKEGERPPVVSSGGDNTIASTMTFYATGDTYVEEQQPTRNYGSDPFMFVMNDCCVEFRGDAWTLIKFNLSGYPSGATLITATLWLYQADVYTDTVSRNIRICRAGSDWNPFTVTWNTRPQECSVYRDFSVGKVLRVPYEGWRAYDVTDLVRGWLDGSVPNYGFSIRPLSTGEWERIYRSYNYDSNHTYWPQLVVNYETPSHCCNGIKDQDETGIDCGGARCPPCNRCNLQTLPSKFDWRNYYDLPDVRNQVACGSCWAFSAVGAVEGTFAVAHCGASINLSEQNFVSNCGCPGSCNGGWPGDALNYIKNKGVVNETCFPYESGRCRYTDSSGNRQCCDSSAAPTYRCTPCKCDGFCSKPCDCPRCSNWARELWTVGMYGSVSSNIDDIKKALICYGPLVVASDNWSHALVLVGYDDTLAGGSWIVRNSWGRWRGTGYGPIPYRGHEYSDIKDYVRYVGGVGIGFFTIFDEGDGLAAGDVNGDGKAEIIHGHALDGMIRVYDMAGTQLTSFNCGFDDYDGLAVGNVTGDGKAEIIHGDRDNWIRVYDMSGHQLASFTRYFSKEDGLAIGDVIGDSMAEIIHGDSSDGRIRVYNKDGRQLASFNGGFDAYDGLAVGDVNGDGKAEIIHGDRDDRIRVYNNSWTQLASFYCDFEQRDGLAAGDVNGDGKAEIIHGDRGDWVRIYNMNGAVVTEFRLDFEEWDRLTTGDVNGNGKAEIIHGDRGDWVRIFSMGTETIRPASASQQSTLDLVPLFDVGAEAIQTASASEQPTPGLTPPAPSCKDQTHITGFGLENPSAVYCAALGYSYYPESGGRCELPDKTVVDAWAFLEGKVGQNYSYCAKMGYPMRTVTDSQTCLRFLTDECAVCRLPDGSEVEVTKLMGLSFKETTCGDGTCGIPENFQTCPNDCPSGGRDGYCDGVADGICDEDCEPGMDRDCLTPSIYLPLVLKNYR